MGGVQGGRGEGGKVNLPPLQRFNTRRGSANLPRKGAKIDAKIKEISTCSLNFASLFRVNFLMGCLRTRRRVFPLFV